MAYISIFRHLQDIKNHRYTYKEPSSEKAALGKVHASEKQQTRSKKKTNPPETKESQRYC